MVIEYIEIAEVVKEYGIDPTRVAIKAFGSGHINDTYLIEDSSKKKILQRINHTIFKDVKGLMRNMVAITSFLKQQNTSMQFFEVTPTQNNAMYYRSLTGNYWRMITFIPNAFSYDRITNTELAYQGGKGYGSFLKLLDHFPVTDLAETLPDFHNVYFRIQQFEEAIHDDKANRLKGVKELVNKLLSRKDEMQVLQQLKENQSLPIRVTHNDTKINNILFTEDMQVLSVVDMDTVMPGLAHFDFGDAIRTFTNAADEDEKDLSKVEFKLNYFEAFTKGYLSETKHILSELEKEHLAFSAKYIVYEQCIRFLSDYLNGDCYYKTQYLDHNLVRAKVQFVLLLQMEKYFDKMQAIVKAY